MLDHEFNLKPSWYALSLITLILAITVAILYGLPINAWIKLGGWLFVLIYGGYLFKRFGLLQDGRAITRIKREQDGKWLLQTKKNVIYTAELQGDSTVTTWLSVLRFRVPKRFWPISCIVFRDSLTRDHYRKLLVLVRMY